ncbi:MAG TPA: glycosyltransferase family 9 protein, partial [Pirellulales bacterium]|nr:glycosyltransferase family 9 protein [Pirellulales bacterium]
SLVKRRRPRPERIDTIHMLRTAGIGDTVLLLGALAQVRETYPRARFRVFLGSSNAAMAPFFPKGVEIVVLPVTRPLASLAILRQNPCDVMLDFGLWPRLDALMAGFSGARWVIGTRRAGQFRHGLYDVAVPFDEQRHAYDNYAAIVAPLGVSLKRFPSIDLGAERQNIPGEDPKIVVHMFPGGRNADLRTWAADKWVQLIDRLAADGFRVLLTGSKANYETAAAIRSCTRRPEFVELAAGCSLRETIGLLTASDCVVTVDTGVMHLAAAAGCRIVSLHGPMSPRNYGPLSDTAISLEAAGCGSCARLGGERCQRRKRCIDDISIERVMAAVHEATFRKAPSSKSALHPYRQEAAQ